MLDAAQQARAPRVLPGVHNGRQWSSDEIAALDYVQLHAMIVPGTPLTSGQVQALISSQWKPALADDGTAACESSGRCLLFAPSDRPFT